MLSIAFGILLLQFCAFGAMLRLLLHDIGWLMYLTLRHYLQKGVPADLLQYNNLLPQRLDESL